MQLFLIPLPSLASGEHRTLHQYSFCIIQFYHAPTIHAGSHSFASKVIHFQKLNKHIFKLKAVFHGTEKSKAISFTIK